MARKKDKEKAIKLRLMGKSYSQIREEINVSKSTLSSWLDKYPLSNSQIKKLRDWNPRRIENFRKTMKEKKEARLATTFKKVSQDISELSKRDIFIGGLFLYWAEGTKTSKSITSLSNTDPSMLRFFISWLETLGIERKNIKLRLHLYSDMDIDKYTRFWARELGIPTKQFRRPYIKKSDLEYVQYKGGHGHGTCNVIFGNQPINDYIMMSIKYIRELCGK